MHTPTYNRIKLAVVEAEQLAWAKFATERERERMSYALVDDTLAALIGGYITLGEADDLRYHTMQIICPEDRRAVRKI